MTDVAKESQLVSTNDHLVELRDVHYSINGRAIFAGLNLTIQRGRITAIMGPSGTGKTRCLRLITGQIRPSSGTVIVEGRDVSSLSLTELYDMRRRMGMLFQNGALLTDMTVSTNVAFPAAWNSKLPEKLSRHIALAKLQAVGLRGAWQFIPRAFGGMARRVALARAIATDPSMLIYDEPFAGLDPISMGVILRLIRQMNDALGLTVWSCRHDVDEIALLADTSFILAGGKVVASGETKALKNSDVELVRQFMNGLPDGPVPFHYPAPDFREHLLASEK